MAPVGHEVLARAIAAQSLDHHLMTSPNDDDRAALAEALIKIVGSERSEGHMEPDSHQQCDCPLILSGPTITAGRTADEAASLTSRVVRVFVTGSDRPNRFRRR